MKKLIFYFCSFIFVLLLSQCSSDKVNPDKIIFLSNLEKCTMNEGTLTDEIPAHSGIYCSKVDSAQIYSFGVNNYLKYLSKNQIKKIKVNAWALMPVLTKDINLVIEIGSNGNMGVYRIKDLSEYIHKANKWTKISDEVNVPDNISNENILKVYIWSANKRTAYLDDLVVSIE